MDGLIRCYKPGGRVEDFKQELMTIEDLQVRLSGWVEVYHVGPLSIMCDEEGNIKGLPICRNIHGVTFVGDLYVGILDDDGLRPASLRQFEEFERTFND